MTAAAIVVALLIAGFLAYAAFQPDEFRIARRIGIKAPPEKIFPLIDNLKLGDSWGPWSEQDPLMKKSFSGPASGVGAVHEWDGNNKVGKGRIEIVESVAPALVRMKLDHERPMQAHNHVEFTLESLNGETVVTWAMRGKNTFMGKVMGLLFCERMVNGMFDKGLSNMKAIAERD